MAQQRQDRSMTTATDFGSWIAFRKPNPEARLRLFCFPYAGGGAAIFRTWSDGLPADVEVCPVQFPGRGTRLMEAPFTQLSPLVQALAQALAHSWTSRLPSSVTAWERWSALNSPVSSGDRFGVQPVRLFVSAARAPQIPPRDRPIHALPEGEFLDELRRLNGIPGKLLEQAELMQIMIPILRADFAVYETYAVLARASSHLRYLRPLAACRITG